jgi:monothiol glutaredoxin
VYEVSQRMPLSPETKSQIESLISNHQVMLFMKGNKHFPQCGFSARVVKILNEVGVKFETANVLSDPSLRDGLKEFSDWPTIPQLYINKEFVGGCDIITEMFNSGDLQKLIGGATPGPVKVPAIELTSRAAKAFSEAAEEGMVLRLEVSAEFQYDLFFDAKLANDVIASSQGLTIHMNAASAKRADGMKIDFVPASGGGAFRIENPNEPARVKSIRVQELRDLMTAKEDIHVFDVRGADERAIANIEGSILLDASGEATLNALPKEARVVFQCHHGGRSRAAAERFLKEGFRNVFNLEGGIDAWSQNVDASVKRY